MSLLRRWFDPLRSNWFYQKPIRQEPLSIDQGLTIYLRLDDVYSYLAVQQLGQLNEILSDDIKPLKIIISDTAAEPPNEMSADEWRDYSLRDAQILAHQHRFAYDNEKPELPNAEALKQAETILRKTPLKDQNFLYLLEDVFHMLWQQQYGKLRTLYVLATQHQYDQELPERQFNHSPVLASYFEVGGRKYHAVDDLLRLTRRLKKQKLLTDNPIFLINHIEWREHLMNDAEELSEIQAMNPELDLYIALEDPISWLLLAYIKEELADYYDIALNVYPLNYQGRDIFDWSLATRLSKRTDVKFTPFCRPNEASTLQMAKLFYSVNEERRTDAMYEILQAVWSKGKDPSYRAHFEQLQHDLDIDQITTEDIEKKLKDNELMCEMKSQPDFPVIELRIDGKSYVFNSLYRVWMIESIFSNVLEQKYKSDNELEHKQEESIEDEERKV